MRIHKIVMAGTLLAIVTATAAGAAGPGHRAGGGGYAASIDNGVYLEVGNLAMAMSNTGAFAYDPTQSRNNKPDGLYYPNGTPRSVIFAGGIWIGAKVGGAVRLAVSEFSSEFVPGPMADGTYQTDRGSFHVYKIGRGDDAESNPDFANWPFDDGAPAVKDEFGVDLIAENGQRTPLLLGDQALYAVCNDAAPAGHGNHAGSTQPLGVELHQYAFAFARGGALGQTIFLKFLIVNKGSNQLDDTYVSLWCDPDVGDAGDDLVGCDTTRSLGFAYNAEGGDAIYGEPVPAVGYDFLRGPIVPSPGDTAHALGRAIPDFRNLPMTSFNKYRNGTDPENSTESYNYMLGLDAQGETIYDDMDEPTLFQVAGDPVTGEGWLDSSPADRRYMMSTGPFNMAPGDTQEVVIAVLVGQGSDALSSVSALQLVSDQAQGVFDADFNIPNPPPQPIVWAQAHNNAVDLIWDGAADYDEQASDELGQVFQMEGYNIYQGETATGPWKKIATFDVPNGVTAIYNDVRNVSAGGFERVIVQNGEDNGLVHHLWLTNDAIAGGKLVNHRPYHFAVAAYSFDTLSMEPYVVSESQQGIVAEVLETRIAGTTVVPNGIAVALVDTAMHVSGKADGRVVVRTVNPYVVTGDRYEVSFNTDLSWNLVNTSADDTLLSQQANQSGDYDYSVVDGILVQTSGPDPDINDVDWSGSEEPWVSSVYWGGRFFDGGFEIGRGFFGSALDDTQLVDVEIRFSPTVTQKGYRYLRGADPNYAYHGYHDVPLTAWDVSVDPPRQLNVCFVENVGLATEDQTWLPADMETLGGREYLFVMRSTYASTPDEDYTSKSILFDAFDLDIMYAWWPVLADGHTADELAAGQVMRVTTNLYNTTADRYEFVAHRPGDAPTTASASALDAIHPVPNPYFHGTDLEADAFNRSIKFVNLPAAEATLTIYNLAGHRIRTIEKTDLVTTEMEWDVLTEQRLPPASGIYIYHLRVPGYGEKIGKLAVFVDREQLTTY